MGPYWKWVLGRMSCAKLLRKMASTGLGVKC